MYRLRNWMFIGFVVLSIVLNHPIGPVAAQEKTQTIYIVQPGDTLDSIARRYDLATADLAMANGLINPQFIFVGQQLVIPTALKATAQPHLCCGGDVNGSCREIRRHESRSSSRRLSARPAIQFVT